MTQEWNGTLKQALLETLNLPSLLGSKTPAHDAMLMTTPHLSAHLSAIRHSAAALLALLEVREGERSPSDRDEAATSLPLAERPSVTFALTERGRAMAGKLRLGKREDLSDGHGLTVKDNYDVVLHTDDPAVVRKVRAYFGLRSLQRRRVRLQPRRPAPRAPAAPQVGVTARYPRTEMTTMENQQNSQEPVTERDVERAKQRLDDAVMSVAVNAREFLADPAFRGDLEEAVKEWNDASGAFVDLVRKQGHVT